MLATGICSRMLTLNLVKFSVALVIGVAVLTGCSVAGDSSPTSSPPTNVPKDAPREVINLSISLFLLVDDEKEPDPTISTH